MKPLILLLSLATVVSAGTETNTPVTINGTIVVKNVELSPDWHGTINIGTNEWRAVQRTNVVQYSRIKREVPSMHIAEIVDGYETNITTELIKIK